VNDHAKVAVTSASDVVSHAHAIFAVADTFARVPLGTHPESVSIRTTRLSVGAHCFLSESLSDDADTPFPMIRVDSLVVAVASQKLAVPHFCHVPVIVVII